ncbi:MAG: DUF3332 domain-containing protein [Bacteroidales bacterium]|nr:DUF3332 domain-containing protein [Bacteroidales bacterium]
MKKIKSVLLGLVFLFVTLSQQGCIGSFQLTKNLYNWNQNEVGGKWGSELVFAAFIIIPVYAVTLFADGIVLNSIEFWTGSNPMAMNAGEKETQIVQKDGNIYKLTAAKNKLHVEKIGGDNSGEQGEFIWNEDTQNWSFISSEQHFKLKE